MTIGNYPAQRPAEKEQKRELKEGKGSLLQKEREREFKQIDHEQKKDNE